MTETCRIAEWSVSGMASELGRMLKAPPLNPQTYIYRYYNIDQTEGSYYFRKYV